jgi:hypothetical protein
MSSATDDFHPNCKIRMAGVDAASTETFPASATAVAD